MPYEITFDKPPAGYAMENASGQEGHLVKVAVREFTSSEDGELFISRLEGLPSHILGMLPVPVPMVPSSIDHLVVTISPGLRAKVYVNECNVFIRARAAKSFKAGEPVREDDIIDVDTLHFEGVEFPSDAAVLCVFSSGWRKGFFFDLTPLGPDSPKRDYDTEKLLGSYYAYLAHQSIFRLDDAAWHVLIDQQWFPFVSLSKALTRKVTAFARSGDNIDRLLPDIVQEVRSSAPRMVERWGGSAVCGPHHELLRHAVDEFLEGDFLSATAILYPRIEGILRSVHESSGATSSPSQKVLSAAAVRTSSGELHDRSWLLPEMFRRYLEQAYFASFEPGKTAKVSRHSVAHGVAAAADFDQKAACIGLLVVDQLFWLLPPAA